MDLNWLLRGGGEAFLSVRHSHSHRNTCQTNSVLQRPVDGPDVFVGFHLGRSRSESIKYVFKDYIPLAKLIEINFN